MRRNCFKALPNELKPREVMSKASSPRNVDDVSLLAVMLKTGARGCDVVELSRRLLKAFGSLSRLVRCDWRELGERIRRMAIRFFILSLFGCFTFIVVRFQLLQSGLFCCR